VSNRALIMLADVLRQRRSQIGTRWRRLDASGQALLVVPGRVTRTPHVPISGVTSIWGMSLVVTVVFAACGAATEVRQAALGGSAEVPPSPAVPSAPASDSWGPHVGEIHFVDARIGWAPVQMSCAQGGSCVVVYATEDGGTTWWARSDRPLPVAHSTETPVVAAPMVRLATKDIGWLVDIDGSLYFTKDGAKTWHVEPGNHRTVALEVVGESVWRLDQNCPTSTARCQYTLVTSTDSGAHWAAEQPQPPIGESGASSLTPSLVRPSKDLAYVFSDSGDYPDASHSGDPPPQGG